MEPKSSTPQASNDKETSKRTISNDEESGSSERLPLPQNINRFGNAPLTDRIISNSSYLAAEIPHKLGHWAKNIWETSTDLSNSVLQRPGTLPGSWIHDQSNPEVEESDLHNQGLWLMGCRYELPDNESLESKIIAAQAESIFEQQAAESRHHACSEQDESRPATDPLDSAASPRISMGNATAATEVPATNKFAVSSLWPADFYEDFTSRLWFTYRHNYPPIRPAHYKTDIGWGCMLRSGQSLLANTLLIHMLGRGKPDHELEI
jgi:cysteine protease ATG4